MEGGPQPIRVNEVVWLSRMPRYIDLHPQSRHECLQTALSRNGVELVCIRAPPLRPEMLRITPMTRMGRGEVRWQG